MYLDKSELIHDVIIESRNCTALFPPGTNLIDIESALYLNSALRDFLIRNGQLSNEFDRKGFWNEYAQVFKGAGHTDAYCDTRSEVYVPLSERHDGDILEAIDRIISSISTMELTNFVAADKIEAFLKMFFSTFIEESLIPHVLAKVLFIYHKLHVYGYMMMGLSGVEFVSGRRNVAVDIEEYYSTTGSYILRLSIEYKSLAKVICKLYPDIVDYGLRLSRYMIANNNVESVLRKIRADMASVDMSLNAISHREFEKLVAEIMLEKGFTVDLTQRTRDGGTDLVCCTSLQEFSFKMIVEVKHYQGNVSVNLIREIVGANSQWQADKMVFVASSGYSADALAFANLPAHVGKLQLHDRDDVLKWIRTN
ncbi:MAG: restriction endonuclease [Fimbriimonadaceae bacterium]